MRVLTTSSASAIEHDVASQPPRGSSTPVMRTVSSISHLTMAELS